MLKQHEKMPRIMATLFTAGNIDTSTQIILLIPPPELHLLIGPVNTLYDALFKVWPSCVEWINRLYIKREEYHGGSFNGNDCRKLLKNIAVLEEISASSLSPQVPMYIETFKAFNEVVTSCYGKTLGSRYREKISAFKSHYNKLKINVTPKIHAVIHHVGEFCDLVKKGLSPWSEQTAESLHHDFSKIWESFKVRDTNHVQYGERLLKAIVMYNSQHL